MREIICIHEPFGRPILKCYLKSYDKDFKCEDRESCIDYQPERRKANRRKNGNKSK